MSDCPDLVACARCARHAFLRDVRCPFCAAVLPEAQPDRPRWLGPITRAAVFYGASALASIGCSDPEAAPSLPVVEAPKETERSAAAAPEEPPEVAPPEPIAVVEAPPEPQLGDAEERAHAESGKRAIREEQRRAEERRRLAEQRRRVQDLQRHRLAMPYGAPPFDFVV